MKPEPTLDVRVWRGDAAGGEFATYAVPQRPNQTILDVVTWIQRHAESSLAYRFACRVGMCGSCAMLINGQPRWTCRTHVDRVARAGRLEIAPLRNFPVIRDLVCDMDEFFAKWQRADGRFHGAARREQPVAKVSPESAARRAADAGIECINCGICYAACDLVGWNPAYLGPAALNRAWTLMNDERDVNGAARLAAVAGDAGCHLCHSQQGCATFCPNGLNPTASIAGLKRMTTGAWLRGRYRRAQARHD